MKHVDISHPIHTDHRARSLGFIRSIQPMRTALALAAAAVAVSGCGGGDDHRQPAGAPALAPACTQCGAITPTLYGGSGAGIWAYANASATAVDLPVAIGPLKGQDVTLVFTNDGEVAQPMTAAPPLQTPPVASHAELATARGSVHDAALAYNRSGWAATIERLRQMPPRPQARADAVAPAPQVVGDTRIWHDDASDRETTLARQATMRDGVVVNVWIETTARDAQRVTEGMLDDALDQYTRAGGIYDMLVDIGGPFWGPHKYAELIGAAGQAIHIVIMDTGDPSTLGFFTGANALLAVAETETARSNEALALFNQCPRHVSGVG